MNRIDRLSAILIWLQSRRILTAREIAERFGIGLRTVYRDIRALEEGGVPIGAEAGKGYFLTPGFHLPPVMFTQAEAGALLLGAKLMEKFSDAGVIQNFSAALDKIKAVMAETDQEYVNRLDALTTVLSSQPDNAGLPNTTLMSLQPALAQSRVIRIVYQADDRQPPTQRSIEPLGLCYYANHWHLLAYCHLRSDYRDFRVDRIADLTIGGELFDRRRHADLDQLVQRMVMPVNLQPAKVTFTYATAHRVRDQKYYYGFVGQRELAHGIEMDFLVPEFDYLSRWLLTLVDPVSVTSPESLRQLMANHVRKLADHYH